MMNLGTKAAAGTLLLLTAVLARADELPANSIRLGLYSIFYHASASDLTGPYVPPGVNLDVKDVQTLYVAYVRRLSEHFDLELAVGYPPTTKTVGKGPATLGSVPYDGQVISTAKWLAPTALLNYKFFDESHALRPYVGIGVNYVAFYERRSTGAGNAASGGPTRLSLTSSVGPAATAGISYRLANNWNLYASYSVSRVKTRLRADTAGTIRTSRIDFGPQALVLAAGYSF